MSPLQRCYLNNFLKVVLGFVFIGSAVADGPEKPMVITSIKPLALITQELTKETPIGVDYLLPPTVSEHSYALRFSDIKRLQDAELVIWLDKDMEPYLYNTEGSWLQPTQSEKSLVLLPLMKLHASQKEEHHEATDEDSHTVDPHIWLSPLLSIAMAENVSKRLTHQFPLYSEKIATNFTRFKQSALVLDSVITTNLKPYKKEPFLVYHNAYGYFVAQYALNQIGTLHIQPGSALSLKQLTALQQVLDQQDQEVCVFREPQFEGVALPALTGRHGLKAGMLDPLGIGASSYAEMMVNLSKEMVECFEKGRLEKKKA